MKDLRFGALRRPFVLATTIAALLAASTLPCAIAANTWDGGGGNGNWNTAANWDADTLPTFGTGITFAGVANFVTNNDLVGLTVGGITFDPAQEAFVLGGNAITLSGGINDNSTGGQQMINLPIALSGPQTVSVIEDAVLTIGPGENGSGVISGAASLTKTGPGSLRLEAVNTYTGNTILDGGLLAYAADNLGVKQIIFGPAAQSTTTSSLDLSSASVTATGLVVQTLNSGGMPNFITIGAGKTLAISGAIQVGTNATSSSVVPTYLIVTGEGTLNATNASNSNFIVGVGSGNNNFATMDVTMDMSTLSNFVFSTGTGNFYVGYGTRPRATLRLANTSNIITAASIEVGNSAQTPGFTGLGTQNNAGQPSNLFLGDGTNVLNVNTINLGFTKGVGIIQFQNSTGSVTINGQGGGASTTNITVGRESSGSGSTGLNQLLLAGHNATVQGGNVFIGENAGSTAASNGIVTFDTGTFTVNNFQLARHTTSGTGPAAGTFLVGASTTVGSTFPIANPAATGVFTVNSTFNLANQTFANTSGTTSGTFGIYGGTANINADIVDASTAGTRTTTLTLAGGTLNMTGHSIGSTAAPITTVNMPVDGQIATLANLGGQGINGAGLTMNGDGTLILEGANTYTGSTAILSGTLQIGTGGATGTLPAGGVINNGVFVLNRTGVITLSNPISGTGTLQQTGGGTVILTSASTYAGPTDINAGALVITGSLTSDVNLNAGTLAGAGNGTTTGKVGNVTMSAGSNLRPGATGLPGDAGTLTMSSLTVNGGDLQFDLGATSDLVAVSGAANFTAASMISPSPAAPAGTYTVLTAGTLTLGVIPSINAPFGTRKTFAPDYSTANTIKLVVAGASKAIAF